MAAAASSARERASIAILGRATERSRPNNFLAWWGLGGQPRNFGRCERPEDTKHNLSYTMELFVCRAVAKSQSRNQTVTTTKTPKHTHTASQPQPTQRPFRPMEKALARPRRSCSCLFRGERPSTFFRFLFAFSAPFSPPPSHSTLFFTNVPTAPPYELTHVRASPGDCAAGWAQAWRKI